MSPDIVDHARSRAILIGSSTFVDPDFPDLPAAANSLAGMAAILTDPALCGWPPDRVTVIRDPTDTRRLTQTLRRLAAGTEDVLFFYFVGHGVVLDRGQLSLVLSDTDRHDEDVTGLEYERIRGILRQSPAGTKIVVLDCCYSGRAIEALGDDVASSTETRGAYVLTASDHTAHVPRFEDQADRCTSFTGELLELVRAGVPGGPARLPLGVLYPHLRQRLKARGLPEPNQRGTDTVESYVFTRNAAPPVVVPQPAAGPPVAVSKPAVAPPPAVVRPTVATPPPAVASPLVGAPPASRASVPFGRTSQPVHRWVPSGEGPPQRIPTPPIPAPNARGWQLRESVAGTIAGALLVLFAVLYAASSGTPTKLVVLALGFLAYAGLRAFQAMVLRGVSRNLIGPVTLALATGAVLAFSFSGADFWHTMRTALTGVLVFVGILELAAAIRLRPGRWAKVLIGVLDLLLGLFSSLSAGDLSQGILDAQRDAPGPWLFVVGATFAVSGILQFVRAARSPVSRP